MRWKLLLVASLAATLVGAGGSLGIAYGLRGGPLKLTAPASLLLSTLIIPLVAITFAAIFVYRHTARRRKLQATLTTLLAIILTLATLFASALLIARRAPVVQPAPTPTPRNIS